jgi:putative tryptophan/tyrosine transport system substrate-binding protein
MRLRTATLVVAFVGLLMAPMLSDAQRPAKIARIGYLALTTPATTPHLRDAFQQALRELGWVEGQNLAIEFRYAEEKFDRLREVAAELVQRKVDLILAAGNPAALAVKPVTTTIPIVMVAVSDPVGRGFVTSLARPGGNITGLAEFGLELREKNLELLKEVLPTVSRVVVLWNPANPIHTPQVREMEVAASALGMELRPVEVRGPDEFDSAFQAAARTQADALITVSDAMFHNQHARIAELAAKSRLPAVFPERPFADAGGLMAYGPSVLDSFRRAAYYVDRILKGAKPADLPVEQPRKFELVINLKTAKALDLTISPSLLFQADEVIQ